MCLRLAELMSSSADLVNVSGFLQNVTDDVTAPTEVTKMTAALLMNSAAGTDSASQRTSSVTDTTSAGTDLMNSSVGHASLGSMCAPMLSALSGPNAVTAALTVRTSRTKQTVLQMPTSTSGSILSARQ